MAFRTGNIENSHQLSRIIHSMMRDEGWSLVSSYQSDGRDILLYSTGTDGYQDIYVRVAGGLADTVTEGDVQFPKADGYTGYTNFFAYQSCVAGGNGNNEIGKNGPSLYVTEEGDRSNVMYEYNMMTSTTSVSKYRVAAPKPFQNDNNTMMGAWDGHKYTYHNGFEQDFGGTSTNQAFRLNLRRGYANRIVWYERYQAPTVSGVAFWTRTRNDTPLVYNISSIDNAIGRQYVVINQDNIDEYRVRFFGASPWSAVVTSLTPTGFAARTFNRNGDGDGYVYTPRSSTTDWFRYDVEKDLWSSYSTSLSPVLPFNMDDGDAVMVPKEVSGYSMDRLYVARGDASSNHFASIAIDDDGFQTGSWTVHANIPVFTVSASIWLLGNYIMVSPSTSSNGDRLYKWQLPVNAGDSGSWSQVGNPFFFRNNGSKPSMFFQHHLSSRVRVREREDNIYWASVNKDRVAVVTRTAAPEGGYRYHYTYAGLFNTYYDKTVTTLTQAATIGATSLTVDNVDLFKIGENYQIVDVTGNNNQSLTDVAGNTYRVCPSEIFTVSAINRATKTLTTTALVCPYAVGSKLGQDPQPVMVRQEKVDRAQTLNNINTGYNGHTSKDPAWQWYFLREPHQSDPNHADTTFDKFRAHNLSYSTTRDNRTGETKVWPVILSVGNDNDRAELPPGVVPETRGQLINVFYCGSPLEDEAIIEINGDQYIVFHIYESDLPPIAIGPME